MLRLLSLKCAWWALLGCPAGLAAEANAGLASFYAAVPNPAEKFTAAHRTLPFGTMVSVVRVDTGAQAIVRINDRGPFIKGRIIDLSLPAARQLGMVGQGLARVRIQVIPAPVPARKRAANAGAGRAVARD